MPDLHYNFFANYFSLSIIRKPRQLQRHTYHRGTLVFIIWRRVSSRSSSSGCFLRRSHETRSEQSRIPIYLATEMDKSSVFLWQRSSSISNASVTFSYVRTQMALTFFPPFEDANKEKKSRSLRVQCHRHWFLTDWLSATFIFLLYSKNLCHKSISTGYDRLHIELLSMLHLIIIDLWYTSYEVKAPKKHAPIGSSKLSLQSRNETAVPKKKPVVWHFSQDA